MNFENFGININDIDMNRIEDKLKLLERIMGKMYNPEDEGIGFSDFLGCLIMNGSFKNNIYLLFETVDAFFEKNNVNINNRKKQFNMMVGCFQFNPPQKGVIETIFKNIINKYYQIDLGNKKITDYLSEEWNNLEEIGLNKDEFIKQLEEEVLFKIAVNYDVVTITQSIDVFKKFFKDKGLNDQEMGMLILKLLMLMQINRGEEVMDMMEKTSINYNNNNSNDTDKIFSDNLDDFIKK